MLDNIVVRRYCPGEENELWRLCRDTTRNVNGMDYTKAQVDKWAPRNTDEQKWKHRMAIKNPFVAERDGQLLGFAEQEGDGHISGFYAHHAWQRKGVGTALYGAVEAEALHNGLSTLRVEASKSAKSFFTRLGIKEVEAHEFEDCNAPTVDYFMCKHLNRVGK